MAGPNAKAYACRRDFEYLLDMRAVNAALTASLRLTGSAVVPQFAISAKALRLPDTVLGETAVRPLHPFLPRPLLPMPVTGKGLRCYAVGQLHLDKLFTSAPAVF